MKIDKAIELLTQMSEPGVVAYDKPDLDAIKLGAEALKRLQRQRSGDLSLIKVSLPGETTEEDRHAHH